MLYSSALRSTVPAVFKCCLRAVNVCAAMPTRIQSHHHCTGMCRREEVDGRIPLFPKELLHQTVDQLSVNWIPWEAVGQI